jgi:hypothetical protein
LVVTPSFLTSSGSLGWAMATRFCTNTCAMSRLVPSSNTTSIVSTPSLVLREVMYSIRSTPLISCSIGVPTVLATVTALAPG